MATLEKSSNHGDIEEQGRDSDCSVEVVDLESGTRDVKLHLDCRICHMSLLDLETRTSTSSSSNNCNQESGVPIELGCSCKSDLAVAHKHCAETWFKIKGNKTCEICGSIARNVVGSSDTELTEQWNEANDATTAAPAAVGTSNARSFWQGHRFLNFLLACMVFAFVISWLFHFNMPS